MKKTFILRNTIVPALLIAMCCGAWAQHAAPVAAAPSAANAAPANNGIPANTASASATSAANTTSSTAATGGNAQNTTTPPVALAPSISVNPNADRPPLQAQSLSHLVPKDSSEPMTVDISRDNANSPYRFSKNGTNCSLYPSRCRGQDY